MLDQEEIIRQYKLAHDRGWFGGTAIKGWVGQIGELIKETESKTLLDYGCGKARYYLDHKIHDKWGVALPYLYDPGLPEFEKKPPVGSKFDGVICTDVMEHLVDPIATSEEIFGYATKFVFMTIACIPSAPQKKLPNGVPFHICVQPPNWWLERLKPPEGVRFAVRFTV